MGHSARRRRNIALAGTLVGAFSVAFAAGASAAFPGSNGRIAFEQFTGSSYDINSIDPSGSNPTFLAASSADELDQSYSASGRSIVYAEILVGSKSGYDIWRMRADGTGKKRLTRSSADDQWPCYSPTGTQIAFMRDGDLWIMRSDGTHQRRIRKLTEGTRPAWSPSGKLIAYQDELSFDQQDIYVVRPDGTHVLRLTHAPKRANAGADWSPAGHRIAFSRVVGGSVDIYSMRPNGSDVHPLIATPKDEFDPAYSPDGKQIVFTSDDTPSGYLNIFRAGIAAGKPHELSTESQNEYSPTWQPLR
jgi:Tol biopolymer transport system component